MSSSAGEMGLFVTQEIKHIYDGAAGLHRRHPFCVVHFECSQKTMKLCVSNTPLQMPCWLGEETCIQDKVTEEI